MGHAFLEAVEALCSLKLVANQTDCRTYFPATCLVGPIWSLAQYPKSLLQMTALYLSVLTL
jgi:hypothetical protein